MKTSLAILDWGIGGMGCYRALKTRMAHGSIIYFSDSGATPYGRMSRTQLISRLQTVSELLVAEGATALLVACNAASTALPFAAGRLALPTTGIIEHAVRAVEASRVRVLGIVGGKRTILSQTYRKLLPQLEIRQRIAQPLSAQIEAGHLDAPETLAELRRIVGPLRGVDALLLACTHYPAISRHFAAALPGVTLIDPVDAAVEWVLRNWQLQQGPDRFLTTGDPNEMCRSAHLAFGVKMGTASQSSYPQKLRIA